MQTKKAIFFKTLKLATFAVILKNWLKHPLNALLSKTGFWQILVHNFALVLQNALHHQTVTAITNCYPLKKKRKEKKEEKLARILQRHLPNNAFLIGGKPLFSVTPVVHCDLLRPPWLITWKELGISLINHRMASAGKDLKDHQAPVPCCGQGYSSTLKQQTRQSHKVNLISVFPLLLALKWNLVTSYTHSYVSLTLLQYCDLLWKLVSLFQLLLICLVSMLGTWLQRQHTHSTGYKSLKSEDWRRANTEMSTEQKTNNHANLCKLKIMKFLFVVKLQE